MRSKSLLASAVVLFIVFTANACFAAVPDSGLIMKGSQHETPFYVFDSGKKGNAIMIIGGTHGNEPSGHEAAKALYEDYLNDRRILQEGKLIIIPAANITGLKTSQRRLGGIDLNRQYPGDSNGNDAQKVAYQIDQLMKSYNVQMVIDLHSGFRNKAGKGMGNTVRGTAGTGRLLAKEAAAYVNSKMGYQPTDHKYWKLGGIPKDHTTAWNINQPAHGNQKPGFTVETLRRESSMKVKVQEHLYVIEYLLQKMGLSRVWHQTAA